MIHVLGVCVNLQQNRSEVAQGTRDQVTTNDIIAVCSSLAH